MRPELAVLIAIAAWIILGKIIMHLFDRYAWKQDKKYRSQVPHATQPPKKPTFFNHNKTNNHGKTSK